MMQEVLIDDDGGELAQVLVDLNRAYPDFASLTITNARGLVVATTDAALRKADLTDAADEPDLKASGVCGCESLHSKSEVIQA
jgi:hypothetical protein